MVDTGGVIAARSRSAATTGGWVLTRYSVLTKAVLPTNLSPNADRLGTSIALATAIGGAILTVRSGVAVPDCGSRRSDGARPCRKRIRLPRPGAGAAPIGRCMPSADRPPSSPHPAR